MRAIGTGVLACVMFATAARAWGAPLDDAYDALTAHHWRGGSRGPYGHTESLVLRRDGTYHWRSVSDYVERDDQGRWSLEVQYPGKMPVETDEGEGRPSRWNTLRALRVLDWYSAGDYGLRFC